MFLNNCSLARKCSSTTIELNFTLWLNKKITEAAIAIVYRGRRYMHTTFTKEKQFMHVVLGERTIA